MDDESKGASAIDPQPRRRARRGWAIVVLVVFTFILGPFAIAGEYLDARISSWVAELVSATTIAVTIVGALVADVVLPIPSSLVATLAGHQLGVLAGTACVWLGLMLGCLVGYALGACLGQAGLRRIVGDEEIARARAFSERGSGKWALAVSRAVPVLAEASVLLAGAVRMRWTTFIGICTLANLGVALAFAASGAAAALVGQDWLVIVGALVLPGIASLAARRRRQT